MLSVRRFTKDADEAVWVEVSNSSRKGRENWRAITVEEMILEEKGNPSFDLEGRSIAELDGKPVGVVHARVDKLREERKGFIRLDVIPESRGSGIERQLVETALTELKARGTTMAQAWADSREEKRTAYSF
jgi:GNAT superfamily N-acetyltransferase